MPQSEKIETAYDKDKSLLTLAKKHPIIFSIIAAFSVYATTLTLRQVLLQIKNRIALVRHLQKRLSSLVAFHNLLEQIDTFLHTNPDLAALLPSSETVSKYIHGTGQEHRRFISNLQSRSFKEKSYFWATLEQYFTLCHSLLQYEIALLLFSVQ